MAKIDFKQVNGYALASIQSVLVHWLPDGKLNGTEYVVLNPRRDDSKKGSFSINVNTGVWSDFACGDSGGDVISLIAYLENCKQGEAAKKLINFLGLDSDKNPHSKPVQKPKLKVERPTLPVPDDATKPPLPSSGLHWRYTDINSKTMFYVCRVDKQDGSKFFYPLAYFKSKGWIKKNIPAPRPLYKLHEIVKHKDKPVLICEGEKACEASQKLIPDVISSTPSNGAQSPKQTDWSVLKGRDILIWTDHDKPGYAFADNVAQLALKAGASSVKKINTKIFSKLTKLTKGWDAADALEAGINKKQISELMEKPDFFIDVSSIKQSVKPTAPQGEVKSNINWKKPNPLNSSLLPVIAFSYDLMPNSLKNFVQNETERLGCPPDYIAVSVMVVISAALGNSVLVKPKKLDNWQVCPNLWGAIIGRPSAMKSPSKKSALFPLKKQDKIYANEYQENMKEHKVTMKAIDIHQAAISKEASRPDLTFTQRKNILKKAMLDEPEKPIFKSLIVEDVTVEALGIKLADNPKGLLVDYDELSGFISRLERPDNPTDKAFFLKAFDGLEGTKVDRVSRDPVYISKTTVSILGTIQPDKLKSIVDGSLDGTSDDGLIQRFQMMVYPDSTPSIFSDTLPDKQSIERYKVIINNLLKFREQKDRHVLSLSNEAYDIFVKWWNKTQTGDTEYSSALESHLMKYKSLVPSLALIIELADNHTAKNISGGSMAKACAWSRYLFSHAKRIYGAGFNTDFENAKTLVDRFDKLPNPFKIKDISNKHWTGLKVAATIKQALHVLEGKGHVHSVSTNKGGRPSTDYYINPYSLV